MGRYKVLTDETPEAREERLKKERLKKFSKKVKCSRCDAFVPLDAEYEQPPYCSRKCFELVRFEEKGNPLTFHQSQLTFP